MRRAFISELVRIAARDSRIVLITGDVGYSVIEPFAESHPSRYFNAGVAEHNMVGVATGLAASGFIPFVYSIATFASLRPFEAIRNGPVWHGLPVRIVGVGGGFEYGHAGLTHYALEDVAVMRTLPGIRIVVPADGRQAREAVAATWDGAGPTYYRLGKDEETLVEGIQGGYDPSRTHRISKGRDLLLVAMGPISRAALAASRALLARGVSAGVTVVSCVQPAPLEDLAEQLASVPAAVSVEEHSTEGGLGSILAALIAERGLRCTLVRCGVRGPLESDGDSSYLRDSFGLNAAGIAEAALSVQGLRTL